MKSRKWERRRAVLAVAWLVFGALFGIIPFVCACIGVALTEWPRATKEPR